MSQMTNWILNSKTVGFGAALLLAFGAAATPAFAEGEKKKQSAWVKLCEKAPTAKVGEDGKITTVEKNICLTHHERLDGNTGMVLVSAAIREIEGSDEKRLMVMVPLGMAIPPGVRAAVYNGDQWAKASKNEKIDEKALKPVSLKYSLCHAAGCTAEIVAPAELIESMKTGGGLMVLAMNAQLKPIAFPVPLTGFTAAHTGDPVDNKAYAQARSKLMAQIRERQLAAAKAYREVQAGEKPGEGAAAPAADKKKK